MAKERTKTPATECPDVIQCERRLATLEANVIHVKDKVDEIKSVCGHIERAVRGGNGVAGHEQRIVSLEESRGEHEEAQRSTRRWLRGIIAAIIAGTVGFAIQHWTSK